MKQIKDQKSKWEKKIKEIEFKVKDQSKMLSKLEDDEDYLLKHKALVEELRMWKEKVNRSEQ